MLARLSCFAVLAASCALAQTPVYQNPNAPLAQRVDDLLSRMTLDEKASQMLSASPAIERLGVPAYDWWNECLHGVARAGVATVFPQPIGMAATFDSDLFYRIGTVISDEARAKHHEFARRGKRGIYEGLTFWTPNINLFRDPRWGRGMETYGEDPYLTGRLAVQFVRGMQGSDPRYLKTVATAKHYAVHSGPESTRHTFNAQIDDRDLFETYLPHFEAAVREGGALSVMCAYNSVGGQPACANTRLLDEILRNRWKFPGYVVSDCGAISDIYLTHKYLPTAEQGIAAAVKAGTDLDCGLEYERLAAAVRQGFLAEKDIDTAVRRLLTARFRLGMFDPPEMVPYAQIPYSANDSPEHAKLALETARKSIVLLKNEGGLLPLDRNKLKTIAVVGPNADSLEVLLGNYNGDPTHPVTPLRGIRDKVGRGVRVLYAPGSELAPGVPVFEPIPSSALFVSDGNDRKRGLNAEYYGTAAFNGRAYFDKAFVSPAMRKAAAVAATPPKPVFTRIDPQVDFKWRGGAPRAGMNDDDFGVRWTGFVSAPETGKYAIGAHGMNAFELTLDGKQIARFNNVHERGYAYGEVALEAGKLYPIQLDFHEVHGDADIRLVWSKPRHDDANEVKRIVTQADVVVMVLGLSPRLEGEEMRVEVPGFKGGDRVTLGIPEVQERLLQWVSTLGKPVVLVLMNGSAVAVNWARDHVPAMVELWYPGQAGGAALADVLFGDYNPSGRLPVTFYKSEGQLPPFDDYNMKGRTYRYFEGEPLFPFGYGLSYTTFAYANLDRVAAEAYANQPIKATVDVKNTGTRSGEEVVQLYVKHIGASVPVPVRSLIGFERVSLNPGETRRVEFTIDPSQLAIRGVDGKSGVPPGYYELSAGGEQPGFDGALHAATTATVSARFTIVAAP